jgi:alpha-L-fucosidase
MEDKYEPTLKSVRKHEVPQWYHDAKFGIFIHWSLSSVPAYAPTGRGDIKQLVSEGGLVEQFKYNPYSEWYLNSMKIEGSPARKYHDETYGADYSYDNFAGEFNQSIKSWDPDQWADLFEEVGARYVVLVTKHHDGFMLWPSSRPNPIKEGWHTERDVVGELTRAVKDRGMKMGFYYSGSLDWSFQEEPITDLVSFITNGPVEKEYAEYVDFHWRELIDKYQPTILWNDIGYPPGTNVYELFAYFYNKTPDGVINDRWIQIPPWLGRVVSTWPTRSIIEWLAVRTFGEQGITPPRPPHSDYSTPEYATMQKITRRKWECVRGIGHSFGHNRMETENEFMKADEAVRMLVDIVSKNGNLLLNVGPRSDGSIPDEQIECVRGIGRWLEANGEAVYGTRPWIEAEGETGSGIDIRFTRKGDTLYAILLDSPDKPKITIRNLKVNNNTAIKILGNGSALNWSGRGSDLIIDLPESLPESPAQVLTITPLPDRG